MKITKELKTAILVLSSIALLVWGITFLRGKNIFSSAKTFYVEYPNVEGLSTASSVTINGLVVGKVESIALQKNGNLLVEILMTEPVDVPRSSKAVMYSPGLLGGKQIALEINYKDPTLAKSGDKLASGNMAGLIDGLGEKADPVLQKMDSVLYNVNVLVQSVNSTLDPATRQNLQMAVAELNATMKNANTISGKFDRIVTTNETKINTIVTDFNRTSSNLSRFSNDLDKVELQKLQQVLNKFENTANNLDKMMVEIESGKGNLGKLVKDEQLYQNLESASRELNQVLEDIKLNPRRYLNISVFGKPTVPYQAPIKN